MKKIVGFLLYSTLFFALLIFFLPKENLYYEGEKFIKPYNVIISDEEIQDRGFSLNLSHADIYAMDGIKLANIKELEIMILGLYNSINIENINLMATASSFVPTHIDFIRIRYSVLNPLKVTATAMGDFGEAKAEINLQERLVQVFVTPSKLMKTRFKNSMKILKKSEGGIYLYEYRIK